MAVIAIFTALSIALEPVRIPMPFWPGQYFRLWELPIIIAFLLFGFKIAFSISILNAIGYITLFPDASGILGPPWRIVVMLTVLSGLYLAKKFVERNSIGNKNMNQIEKWKKPVIYFTIFAVLFRVTVMPFVDYAVYSSLLPLVIGRSIPNAYIMGLMPAIIFFNIAVPLYTIPVGYGVAKIIKKNVSVDNII